MTKKKIITITTIFIIITAIIGITLLLVLFKKEANNSEGNYNPSTGTTGVIKLSYTTGLPTELLYQPIMVVIENSPVPDLKQDCRWQM